MALAAIIAIAALLYLAALEYVPIHLHHDEIYFGLLAHSIAETGRDPHGRFMPVYFQMGDTYHWYPPLIIYATAALIKVVSLSDAAVRVPNALIGVASVWLIYFVARRIAGVPLAIAASAILALTPAHFINSRIATDSLYPVLVVQLWLLALARYLEQPAWQRLFLTTTILGIGVYTYIASVVMMPIYLGITMAVVLWRQPHWRPVAAAVAGFAWPLVFAAGFFAANPEVIGHFASKYDLGQAGQALDPAQRLRDSITPWNISDSLNLYFSAFSPGYLFVTGGSNIAHSTRQAGVFLAPLAVFLLAGLIAVIRQPTVLRIVVTAGFLAAPVAATIVPEPFAIPRMLTLLPFGVLLSVIGIAFLWQLPAAPVVNLMAATAGVAGIAAGVAYALFALVTRGAVSTSALALIAVGSVACAIAYECGRRQNLRPALVALTAVMPLQFAIFAADYFGDYRARSAGRYEYNVRGAIEQIIALHDRTPGIRLYLNDDVPFMRGFWDYYLRLHNRPDLRGREIMFDSNNDLPPGVERGSLILTDVNSRAMTKLAAHRDLVQVATATDPVPGTSPQARHTTFVIFQKR